MNHSQKTDVALSIIDLLPDDPDDAIEVLAYLVAHIGLSIDEFTMAGFVTKVISALTLIKKHEN